VSDAQSHKFLREYCSLSGCRVWQAIQDLEAGGERNILRKYCAERCEAYRFVKWIEAGNLKIVRRTGRDKYR
jgi:hypothetical protein